MKDFEIIGTELLNCRVCSSLDEDDTLDRLRKESPSGTSHNWQRYNYNDDPEMKPIACSDAPDTHVHYMFQC